MKYKNENRHWIEDKTRTARTRIGTEDKGRHANIRCKFKVSGGGKKKKRKKNKKKSVGRDDKTGGEENRINW